MQYIKRLAIVGIVFASGCMATSDCAKINARRRGYGGIATLSGALTGAGGVSTLAVEDPRFKTGVAVSSVVLGGVSAFAAYMSSDYAQDYADNKCPVK